MTYKKHVIASGGWRALARSNPHTTTCISKDLDTYLRSGVYKRKMSAASVFHREGIASSACRACGVTLPRNDVREARHCEWRVGRALARRNPHTTTCISKDLDSNLRSGVYKRKMSAASAFHREGIASSACRACGVTLPRNDVGLARHCEWRVGGA